MNRPKFIEHSGRKVPISELMAEYGVHIDTDGNSNFASEEEIRVWQFVVEKMGLAYALHRFFNREEFPKID